MVPRQNRKRRRAIFRPEDNHALEVPAVRPHCVSYSTDVDLRPNVRQAGAVIFVLVRVGLGIARVRVTRNELAFFDQRGWRRYWLDGV